MDTNNGAAAVVVGRAPLVAFPPSHDVVSPGPVVVVVSERIE